ncbi:MAG: hypothetical protein K8T91_00080 [Planctomycetes bacterium]|nr:hypothetical protein [Planctomycetota bacterium]
MATYPADRYQARIAAPSRLHFGLLSLGEEGGRSFGGLGAMIDRPGLQLTLRASDRFEVEGPLAERAAEFARRLSKALGHSGDPPCRIHIESAPPEHVGLGTGTQLGLAVAAALYPLLSSEPAPVEKIAVEQLAEWVGRGARSAIGTHGFGSGGLIFEQGKLPGESVSPLSARVELPEQWRFVLFWPKNPRGLSGDEERDAFRRLKAIPAVTTRMLSEIATEEILPAATVGDIFAFGDALYRYGIAAGMCFAQYQHGAFASEIVAGLVDAIRNLGVLGVGQSSWGPTVYALTADEDRGAELVRQLKTDGKLNAAESMVVAPNNRGARVELKLGRREKHYGNGLPNARGQCRVSA